jgi:hypothetical protein
MRRRPCCARCFLPSCWNRRGFRNRLVRLLPQLAVLHLHSPEFDTFEAHFWVTPGNGAGFRAADRQTLDAWIVDISIQMARPLEFDAWKQQNPDA